MNIFFRVLLAIYAFCLTIASLFAMFVTVNQQMFDGTVVFMGRVLLNPNVAAAAFVVELIFFVLSVVFLLSGFKSDIEKKSISKITNIGEIRIALNTIESIALSAARRGGSVKETKACVLKDGENVSITMKIVVMPDVNIPSLSEELQERIKKMVEDNTGVTVNQVSIFVDNIYTGYRSRIE